MRKHQTEFAGVDFKRPKDWFGGAKLTSHPKRRRPLDRKLPIHLLLRSKKSVLRLPRNYSFINRTVTTSAKKYGIRIYEFANVGNHLHLLIRVSHPELWRKFIREITGRISQLAQNLGARDRSQGFWLHRPFTRLVRGWRRAYRVVKDYIFLNHLEALGYIDREVTRSIKDLKRLSTSVSD